MGMQRVIFLLALNLIILGNLANAGEGEDSKKICDTLLLEPNIPLTNIDPQTHQFESVTEAGIAAIKKARDALRQRHTLFNNEFRQMGPFLHIGTVARITKGHIFFYGPPGSAKTYMVNWPMSGEPENPFKLQLHQMISENAFVGGQNFEAAKVGRFEINTEGSLADFTIALIDEVEKGNPADLATLLSLLNEREVLAVNKVIKALLETLFATSNANLAEIFQQFLENGQGTTAPALLRRFQFKAFAYNWLPKAETLLVPVPA